MYGNDDRGRSGGGRSFGGGGRSFGGGSDRFAPVKVGDEMTVKIEAVGEKGDGIAKKDGFVIFVPGVKQGDEVKIRVNKVLKKVGFAEVIGKESTDSSTKETNEDDEEEISEDNKKNDSDDFGEDDEESFDDDNDDASDEENPEDDEDKESDKGDYVDDDEEKSK